MLLKWRELALSTKEDGEVVISHHATDEFCRCAPLFSEDFSNPAERANTYPVFKVQNLEAALKNWLNEGRVRNLFVAV